MDLNPILNTASLMGTVWLVLRLERLGRRVVVIEKLLNIPHEELDVPLERLVQATEGVVNQRKALERAKGLIRTG